MDKDARVLSHLIENLEDIKGKLASLDYDREWISTCILPEKKSRSYINMKNVLESLVMKTVEGKGYDEDIASICNQHKTIFENHLQFQNLFSSEEYLIEATNLPKTPLKFDFLHSSLIAFQDFLGDILHSICQISSCQLKLPSKILVKDLLKLKNQYLSIWDLTSSVFGENKCHRGSDCSLMGEPKGIRFQVSEMQKSLQTSLKEMSRIKLEIEHYFKCNLIEMQFTKSPNDADSRESRYSKEDILQNNRESEFALFKGVNSSSQDVSSNIMNNCSFSMRKQLNNVALSSPLLIPTEAQSYQTESKENRDNSHNCPPNTETWNNVSNSFVESPCGDFFHEPLLFPPNYLFIDATNVLFQSKKDVKKPNSLPKIYSIDSFSENCNKKQTSVNSFSDQKNNNKEFNKKVYHNVKIEKVDEMPPTKSQEVEGLFGENESKIKNQTGLYSICFPEKISSMFDMLRSSETIGEEEDIFEETPLQIQHSNFSYSQTFQNYNNIKFKTSKENVTNNISSTYISNKHPDSETYKNPTSLKKTNDENISIIKSRVDEVPFYFGGLQDIYKNDKSISQAEKVIYDERSLIELYHTKEVNQGLNAGSTPGEQSNFSLWPVSAEYIQVSKTKRPQKCQSVSSDNSIPLTKSFGKSFYSLHMNKRYEQKHFYDGDLLVLDNAERSIQQSNSSCTLMNKPYSIFDQEQNYNHYEKITNRKNFLGGKFNNKMQLPSSFKKRRDLNTTKQTMKDVKKTLAVHYKDYDDSIKVTDNHFKRENFDFLKVNGFDNNNWNSFISIFTSKVGPTAQINHHRMFRKVVNTFTTDSITCNNVYGNVHTLTSNGGPFRLFDINGYPLTDSSGNVLKDPYGKSVVTLDSTGFPKDDIKVFDAAGNSPNDINFDPTQKPKTNSIIIKLTDNFKRPLHLFDKYGRPLTDSCGKLLVNIHGRPLLRFDNFGRPNTDYRGGPLYTDNGYRWSYRTGDSLSGNQLSNESLMPKKLCGFLESESRQNSYENFCLQDKSGDKSRSPVENVMSETANDRKLPILNPSKSDIWIKVEKLLQNFPKKKNIEPKTSQTSVIINNVTIAQNPIEKEFLKSIIYHNNIIQKDVNHLNRIHPQPLTNHRTYIDFQNINSCLNDRRLTDEHREYCVRKLLSNDGYKPCSTTPFPFQNKIFMTNACSKCVSFDQSKHFSSNKFVNEQSFNLGKAFTCGAGDLLKNTTAAAFTSYPKNGIKNKESYLAHNNHDYLNNLCNEILKNEIDYSDKTKHHFMNPKILKNNDWTDTSITEFPSSIGSKYTTGLTSQTESPYYFSDTSKNLSQDINIQNKYCNGYVKQSLDYCKRKLDILNEDKHFNKIYKTKSNKDIEHTTQSVTSEEAKKQFQNKSALSLSKPNDDTMSIKILNKGNKHYEIKVTEMLSKMIHPKLNFGLFSTGKHNENLQTHTRKIETSSRNKSKSENCPNNMVENKCTKTENYKGKINNSLFRFSSDEIIESTPKSEENVKASYSHKTIYLTDSNVSKNSFTSRHYEEVKHLPDQTNKKFTHHDKVKKNFNNRDRHSIKSLMRSEQSSKEPSSHNKGRVEKNTNIVRNNTYPVKKTVSSNRECNVVSFFGSPVKYVLNKLDGKRSSKPKKVVAAEKTNFISNSTENLKIVFDATHPKDKMKAKNDIKTLYDITKSSKKSMMASSEKTEIKNHKDKVLVNEQDTLLAFRSKSCTGLVCHDKYVPMSYSGDSQSANRKKLSQGFHLSSTKLQKSMSATSYITTRRFRHKDSKQRSTKYEQGKEILKNGKNSIKPNMIGRKYNKIDNNTQKKSKSRKGSSGKYRKSPLSSSRTKAKEISLYRKVEPEGKYMLKIKR